MRIVISSGHGLKIRGASGLIDEVDEARKVVPEVAERLRKKGHEVVEFHDDVSTTQNENLEAIVDFHNSQQRDLDVSVHFNATDEDTDEEIGTEVLYLTQEDLAASVADAIAESGDLTDRGAKYRSDLYFLNHTEVPAILIEVCFVNSSADVEAYQENFEDICKAIGSVRIENDIEDTGFHVHGKVSWFGGPDDMGVSADEGLAFIYDVEDAPHLFLDEQPPGTTGLARRLDPSVPYIACRWDYDQTPKDVLAGSIMALVIAKKNGRRRKAWPADWGPHEDTERSADISPGLMQSLGITTDDEVTVIYPAPDRRHG